jgi:hypothetical protein
MTAESDAFALPAELETNLLRVLTYWRGLVRGYADMPYWDDYTPAALAEVQHDAILADVFPDPLRFRFRIVGKNIAARYGEEFAGKYHDEIALRAPLDRLDAQCAAAVTSRRPAYFRMDARASGAKPAAPYARLVLPMWGNGRVEMLLVAVAPAGAGGR